MGRVHIKWAISQDQTEKLYSELGVENISDESSDSCYALELTPAVFVNKDKPTVRQFENPCDFSEISTSASKTWVG
jgi:hypothetical protein